MRSIDSHSKMIEPHAVQWSRLMNNIWVKSYNKVVNVHVSSVDMLSLLKVHGSTRQMDQLWNVIQKHEFVRILQANKKVHSCYLPVVLSSYAKAPGRCQVLYACFFTTLHKSVFHTHALRLTTIVIRNSVHRQAVYAIKSLDFQANIMDASL